MRLDMHALLDRIFKLLTVKEPDWSGHKDETRHHLFNFLGLAGGLGFAGAFMAFVAWYLGQL